MLFKELHKKDEGRRYSNLKWRDLAIPTLTNLATKESKTTWPEVPSSVRHEQILTHVSAGILTHVSIVVFLTHLSSVPHPCINSVPYPRINSIPHPCINSIHYPCINSSPHPHISSVPHPCNNSSVPHPCINSIPHPCINSILAKDISPELSHEETDKSRMWAILQDTWLGLS